MSALDPEIEPVGANPEPEVTEGPGLRSQSFPLALAAIAASALLLRLVYATRVPGALGGDARFYHELANLVADGRGYINPDTWRVDGIVTPTAFRLPAFPGVLAVFSWLGWRSIEAHRVASCLLGTTTVVILGLLGRRLGGARIGLLTAICAAVYPNLWVTDGLLTVETMYALVVALFLFTCYRFMHEPNLSRTLQLGIATALALLTRTEAILLFVLVAIPVVLRARSLHLGRRVKLLGVLAATAAVLVAPWFLYNLNRFEKPVVMSTNAPVELAAANCDTAYNGGLVGFWDLGCVRTGRYGKEDESEVGAVLQRRASHYVRTHLSDLPRVIVFRVGRVWDVYGRRQNQFNSYTIDARDPSIINFGEWVYFGALPLAGIGVVALRRRQVPVYPLLAMGILVTIVAAVSHGEIRFRVPAEIAIVILAASGIEFCVSHLVLLVRRLRARDLPEASVPPSSMDAR